MEPIYNLVLYHVPTRQCISDFMVIRNMMVGRANDIQVHIISAGGVIPPDFWTKTAKRPTLIFSPSYLARIDVPARGTRLMSAGVSKLEELRLLADAGAATPETRVITPDLKLDEAEWGPFTVVKPNKGLQGRDVRLMRTRDVKWTDTAKLPKDDPRHGVDLLAQRYVDTGPLVTCYRVFTVLGRPIYSVTSTAVEPRAPLDQAGDDMLDIAVAANGLPRKVALAHELFALEYNSGGGVWHLSSGHGLKQQHTHGIDYYRQFNALETITDALIEATRTLAA